MRALLVFLVVLALSCTAIGLEMWAIATTVNIRKQQMSTFPYGPAHEYDPHLRCFVPKCGGNKKASNKETSEVVNHIIHKTEKHKKEDSQPPPFTNVKMDP